MNYKNELKGHELKGQELSYREHVDRHLCNDMKAKEMQNVPTTKTLIHYADEKTIKQVLLKGERVTI